MLSIYYSFNRRSQPFLNALVLPGMSSLTATYSLVASPYLTPVVNFTVLSYGHLASACRTLVFYRRTVENILTGSSAAHRTLTFSIRTDIAKLSAEQHYLHWHLCRPVNIYIMLYNVPLQAVLCNAADLLRLLP
jgi:hypothetical protein